MPEFLVHAVIKLPPGMTEEERLPLYEAEERFAAKYFNEGTFVRCMREAGTRSHWALWDVPDADYVHCAYSTLPLYQLNYLTCEVIALAVNVNDPGYPAHEHPEVRFTYDFLRSWLNSAKAGASGAQPAPEHGFMLWDRVSVHDHPGSERPLVIHVMVDGQKLCEIGPSLDGSGHTDIDFLATWQGRPVYHAKMERRIRKDNMILHPDYAAAVAAQRNRHHL